MYVKQPDIEYIFNKFFFFYFLATGFVRTFYGQTSCNQDVSTCSLNCAEEYDYIDIYVNVAIYIVYFCLFCICFDSSCGSDSIACPSTENCQSCLIDCGTDGCKEKSIFGNSCSTMTINCVGDEGAKDVTIYAPNNLGNLTMNVISGDHCFKDATVIANNTNTIKIHCDGSNGDGNEWYVCCKIIYIVFVYN